MRFEHPALLWLLVVVVPAMAAFFWWSGAQRQALLTRFIQARLLPGLVAGVSARRQRIRFALLILAVGCLIVAAARPQWGFAWDEVKQRGLDIVVAIDTSKSMLANDIAPNRLERAKLAALDLMQQAKSDRLGLVAFAGTAFLQCPLTIDDAAFRQSVESLDVATLPQGGTALAAAIEAALTAFKEGDNFKVLVLLTDGEDQDSGALEGATKAAKAGLQIFTIGIGTPEGELLRITKPDGSTDFVRDEQGNVVKSHLNEDLLRQLAGASDRGFYLPLRGAKTIDTLVEQGLAPLPKTDARERLVKRYHERYQWPLGLGILLLLGETFFPERKRERARRPLSRAGTAASLGKAALVAALLALPAVGMGSPSRALREYKAGNYDQALKDYQGLLQKKKGDDPRLHFNAGTAAYQAQQFDEALKQFNQALSSPDLNMQEMAYYNRGNTQFWLGEQSPDPQKKSEAWQKAVQDFQSSLKLNPQDKDAEFNRQFVKKKLEELKQQQQQQQQSQQNKDQEKNQDQKPQDQQQQNQQQQDQQKQDQQQQSQQQQQDQQSQKQDSQQQQQQSQDQQQQQAAQKEKEQQQQAESQGQKQGQEPKPQPGQQEEKEKSGEEGQAYAAGQMTPEQAKQLLDAQKGEEKVLQFKPEGKPADTSRPFRDW